MWEEMLVAGEPPRPVVRPEEPDFQEYINRQLEREGHTAQGNRLENLPNDD